MRIRSIPPDYDNLGIELSDPKSLRSHHFPDFLIIGPQRTGTTWLSRMLRFHQNCWVTKPKEPFYFIHVSEGRPTRCPSKDLLWYAKLFDIPQYKRKQLFRMILKGRATSYGFIRGEATASYAAGLPEEYLDFIFTVNPNIKIILGVRHPVDRLWSHLKKDLMRDPGIDPGDVTKEEIMEFINDSYIDACGHYMDIIQKWTRYTGTENLFFLQFKRLSETPVDVFHDVCDFLDITRRAPHSKKQIALQQKVNTTENVDIPSWLKEQLSDRYAADIRFLEKQHSLRI